MPSATASLKRILRAMSAPRWQRVSISSRAIAAVAEDVHDRTKPLRRPGPLLRRDEAQRLRQAAVDLLEVVFEGQVVGEVELADARCIAAAAKVLQEERIIEFPDLGIAEADLAADLRADPAAADATAFRLPFVHIEGMAERAQRLRQPDSSCGRMHAPMQPQRT